MRVIVREELEEFGNKLRVEFGKEMGKQEVRFETKLESVKNELRKEIKDSNEKQTNAFKELRIELKQEIKDSNEQQTELLQDVLLSVVDTSGELYAEKEQVIQLEQRVDSVERKVGIPAS